MATQKKMDIVSELTEKIAKSKSIVFADYTGLKHKQLEEFRKNLKKHDAEFVVIKNKLMERSLGDMAADVKDELKSATASLFAYADEVAPLKEMLKFFKTANLGKTKGGILGKTVITDKEVIKLSQLPNRQILIGKLVGQMNAPIQGLHYALSWNINRFVWALNSIKNKKSN
jgi:large subunit ribosomal protein L10